MKKLLLLVLVTISLDFYAQNNPNNWYQTFEKNEWEKLLVDIDDAIKYAEKDPVPFEILIIRQVPESKYHSGIPDLKLKCIQDFNPMSIQLSVYELLDNEITRCKIKINEREQENPNGKSSFYLFSPYCDTSKSFSKIFNILSLDKKLTKNGKTYFESTAINSEDDFCWKLRQLISYLNKIEINQIQKKTVARQNQEIYFGYSSQLNSSVQVSILDEQYSGLKYRNSVANSFNFGILRRINNTKIYVTQDNPNRMSLGLSYSFVKQEFDCSATNFTDQYAVNGQNGLDFINIYGSNVKENFSVSNHRIGVEFRWEKEKNVLTLKGVRYSSFGFSVIPYSIVGSYFNATIVSGDFTYKGVRQGVTEELQNLESLGLVSNVSLLNNSSSSGLFRGFGTTLKLLYSFGNENIGLSVYPYYSFENLRNVDKLSGDYIFSKDRTNYTPSLFNLSKISTSNFGLGVSLHIPIGS